MQPVVYIWNLDDGGLSDIKRVSSIRTSCSTVEFAEGLLNQGIRFPDQKAYKAFWKEVDSFLTEQAVSDPIEAFLTRALITDSIS